MTLHSGFMSPCVVGLWSCAVAGVALAAPAPGDPFEVAIEETGARVAVVFHYCPAGKIRPGKPQLVDKDAAPKDHAPSGNTNPLATVLSGVVEMRPFHISETEVTIEQFRKVVRPETFAAVQARVAKNTGKPELLAAFTSGREFPLFAVMADEAAEFCRHLTMRTNPSTRGESLEARRFRLPSHQEWQYACRAQADPDAVPPLPHFNRWPESYEVLDKVVRAACQEEWKEMGRQEAEFRGTQEQVADILIRQTAGNLKPLEILSAFLKAGLGTQREYADNRPGELQPPRTGTPNAWNLHDMHENVREWVIVAADRAELFRIWDAMAAERGPTSDIESQKVLFLAGGGFNDLMAGQPGTWQEFTIWGGHPMDPKSGSPEPFSLEDSRTQDVAFDEDPGFRVVMERVLRDDWLLIVRLRAIHGDPAELRQQEPFKQYRTEVGELATGTEQAEYLGQIGFYEGLVAYRERKIDAALKQFSAIKGQLGSSKKTVKRAKLEDLLGPAGPAPAGAPESPSEDDVFFSRFERLLAADAAASR